MRITHGVNERPMKEKLKYFYQLWMKWSEAMGFVMSLFWLGIFYLLVLTPVGLFWRLFNHDPLRLKWKKGQGSYREAVDPLSKKHMEDPF